MLVEMDIHIFKTSNIYRVYKWVSFGVLHFVRPFAALHKCAAYILVSCVVLRVIWGHTASVCCFICFIFLVDDYSACIFLACFSCVWLCKYIMKWGQTAPCTHANVPRVKCAVVILFFLLVSFSLCVFFLFESIKYEICFYSFGGYWTIVTAK